MKNLKEYIIEGIFDTDEDTIDKSINDQIKQFLKDNFDGASLCKISDKPNNNGKYEVSSKEIIKVKNKKITSLTNNLFIWTTVDKDFRCAFCDLLTSLEGAPKEVGGVFDCSYCDLLKSLKGAPEKVGGKFNCNCCNSLTSLEGASKNVGGDFNCYGCDLLKSLKGAPEKVGGKFNCNCCNSLTSLEGAPEKVGMDFDCRYCKSLKSLEGAPKEVGGGFYCRNCKVKFSEEDVKKVSNVEGKIFLLK